MSKVSRPWGSYFQKLSCRHPWKSSLWLSSLCQTRPSIMEGHFNRAWSSWIASTRIEIAIAQVAIMTRVASRCHNKIPSLEIRVGTSSTQLTITSFLDFKSSAKFLPHQSMKAGWLKSKTFSLKTHTRTTAADAPRHPNSHLIPKPNLKKERARPMSQLTEYLTKSKSRFLRNTKVKAAKKKK